MKKAFFFLIIFFGPSTFKLNAMESNPNEIEIITKQILNLAFDKTQTNLYKGDHPYIYTLDKLFNLHIKSVEKAYEYLIPNLFKEELDKYLTETIKHKFETKKIDQWISQFEIGSKFRRKIIEIIKKTLISQDLETIIKTYPITSTIRTIAIDLAQDSDKQFTEFLIKKIYSKKEFDLWLKQFEIGSKIRKKIIKKTIKILFNAIKVNINKKTVADFADFIKTYPATSIIRTIVNIYYYNVNSG